jgi:hypothetical protein
VRARHALQVEVVHTQFRVSEDHKLRAMLKKQSAKVMWRLFCSFLFRFFFDSFSILFRFFFVSFLLRVSCGEII